MERTWWPNADWHAESLYMDVHKRLTSDEIFQVEGSHIYSHI